MIDAAVLSTSPRLFDKVRGKIRLKHYSISTEQAYLNWIKQFICHFCKRHPNEMGAREEGALLTCSLSPKSLPLGEMDEVSFRESHVEPTTARLFFALWPSAVASAGLAEAGERLHGVCGGRRTRAETIHLTLAFLGEVGPERIDDLLALAGEIRAPAFCLNLTRFGWWPHNRIVWAASDETPAELMLLVDALREKLHGEGFRFDTKPFVPHVTLLRKADCRNKPLPAGEVEWRADDFVLVRSVPGESGSAYEVVGRWPLL